MNLIFKLAQFYKLSLIVITVVTVYPSIAYSATYLGEIVIEVVEKEEPSKTPDDGYWDWYVKHILSLQNFQKELTETRIQLAHLASEIKRAKAMRFKLARKRMEWLAAKDETIDFAGFNLGNFFESAVHQTARVGPATVKSSRNYSKKLGTNIRNWLLSQEQLINKIIDLQSMIVVSADRQLKKSAGHRPLLVTEVERLRSEETLLKLFLYDYASWYKPKQLPLIIKDLISKGDIDKNLEFLLTAKSKIADADYLEQKAFTEKLKPTPENYQNALFQLATFKGDPLGYLAGRTSIKNIQKKVTFAEIYQLTSQTQRLDAIALLRQLLHTNKDDDVAKSILLEQELYWLKRIAQKLDGQSEMAMSAFSNYLTTRGFSPDDREGWLPWMADYASAIWGLGPISMFAGVPGIDIPGANARDVGNQLMDAARKRIALVAVIKLVKAGNSLTDIKAKSTSDLSQLLREYWGRTNKSSSKQLKSINKMAVDIHSTLRDLKDLDRLSNDDRFEFARDVNNFFAKNYYTPVNSRYQSFESFGDLLNVHNIITLWGPGAITKINGKWARPKYMSFARQDMLQKAGMNLSTQVRNFVFAKLNSSQVMIRGYSLAVIGERIRETKSVKILAKVHNYLNAPLNNSNAIATLLAESSQLVASFYLNNAITELAKSSGIPGAALITEILMSYEVPQGVYDHLVFQSPHFPLTGMIKPLKRYKKSIENTTQILTETSSSIDEASQLISLASRETIDASTAQRNLTAQIENLNITVQNRRIEQFNQVAAEMGVTTKVTVQARPGTTVQARPGTTIQARPGTTVQARPGQDAITVMTSTSMPKTVVPASEEALVTAVVALRNGDIEEAERAVTAARTLVRTAKKDADYVTNRVSKVIDKLESATPSSVARMSNATEELSEIVNTPVGQRDNVTDLIDTELYSKGIAGEELRLADEALRSDDFDTALAHLDEAKRYSHELDEPGLDIALYIDKKKALLAHARDAKGFILQRRSELNNFPALNEINRSEMDDILAKLKNGDYRTTISGKNIAIEVSVGDSKFRIKPEQTQTQIEAEATGAAIAELLGFDTPGSTVVGTNGINIEIPAIKEINADGVEIIAKGPSTVTVENIFVSRHIEQFEPMQSMQEPVLLALRSDYAEQRALRAFLADSDGHLGNIGIGPNGKFWVIDTDLANVVGDNKLRQLDTKFSSDSELVEASVAFAHAKVPGQGPDIERVRQLVSSRIGPSPLYRWINRADQMIQYKDMDGIVKKIKDLVSSDTKIIDMLIKKGINREKAEQIYKVLKQRSSILKDVLNKPSLFGGKAVKMSLNYRQRYYLGIAA